MSTITIAGHGGGITINILRYEREQSDDLHDSNWLTCELEADICPFRCLTGLTFLTLDFTHLMKKLLEADSSFVGEVFLKSEADELIVSIRFEPQGYITIHGSIRPGTISPNILSFEIKSDRQRINQTIADLEAATVVFPVRGVPV